jgi:molybdopterin converting factor subunit 1
MRVRVLLFARAKDLAGTASLEVELPDGATVAGLRGALSKSFPRLGEFLPRCAAAVGGEVAAEETVLAAGVEVAWLPPVSGGMCRAG